MFGDEGGAKRQRTESYEATESIGDNNDVRVPGRLLFVLNLEHVQANVLISSHALTNWRRAILPFSFERQLCLYMNEKFWGIEDAKFIVHGNVADEA